MAKELSVEQKLALANSNAEVMQYEYDKLNSTFLDFVERSKDDALRMAHSNTLLNNNLAESIKLMNKMFDHLVKLTEPVIVSGQSQENLEMPNFDEMMK